MTSYTYEFLDLGEEHALGCKCCRFKRGNDLPIPKKLTNEEIATEALQFSTSIFTNWTKLNAILKRFESTIHKRWLKKTPKQRREILLKAWPGMQTNHRPDFLGFRSVSKQAPRWRTCPSAAYLWPYINLEDLLQSHRLLLFINSRGRNLPDVFVNADFEAAHLGHGWDSIPDKEDGHFMLLRDQHSPRKYGKVLPPPPANDKKKRTAKPITGYHPTFGLLVLEIQQGIYSFVLSCTKLILHDLDPRECYLAQHQPPPTVPDASRSDWPSLASQMIDATYSAPKTVDLERLITLIRSQKMAAEDHLWSLIEDPGYFVEMIKQEKEHDPASYDHPCTSCWKFVAAHVIEEAFSMLLLWDYVVSIIDSLATMSCTRNPSIEYGRLPPELERVTWAELWVVADWMTWLPLKALREGVPVSPRLRHCYLRSGPERDGWDTRLGVTDSERRVDVLFYAITHDDQRNLHGLHHLVQEVQYMLDTDAEASQFVDSFMLRQFADLAMLSEIIMRIEAFEPWPADERERYLSMVEQTSQPFASVFSYDLELRGALRKTIRDSKTFKCPTGKDYDYPVAKRYTEENVNQMRKAESSLSSFWAELAKGVKRVLSVSIMDLLREVSEQAHDVSLTPPWIPPLVTTKKPEPLTERDVNVPRFHDSSTGASSQTPVKCKTKIKTRGTANPGNTEDNLTTPRPATPSTDATPSPMTISVPKRAFKVLSALLPGASAENHQRVESAWDELLQAMNTIGLEPEKLYGSVWIFKPKPGGQCKVDVKRSIQFHEPKEVRKGSKIPPNMVRTFGRRLRHTYGFENGMFVCE